MTYNDEESWGIALQPGRCYLLSTNEMFKVPDDHCSELVALDPRFGHVFSHFAGFFDPGFFGTATLEVYSALPAPVFLRHKQPFAKFVLEKLRSPTVPYANNYQGQIGTKLPKQFKQ
jgi:dCTP deaminase